MKIEIPDHLRSEITDFVSSFSSTINALKTTHNRVDEASQNLAESDEKARSLEQSESLPSDKEIGVLNIARTRRELLASALQKLNARLAPQIEHVLTSAHVASELFRRAVSHQLEQGVRSGFISSLPESLRSDGWQNPWASSKERRSLGNFLNQPLPSRTDHVSEIILDAEERLERLNALLEDREISVPQPATAVG